MDIDLRKLSDEIDQALIFTTMVLEHHGRIYHYCVSRLGESLGEDIAQDACLTAWENLTKFRQESTMSLWLTGIAKNKCIQVFRNRGRRQAIVATFVEDIRHLSHIAGPISPEEMVMDEARRQELAEGMSKMRDDERLLLHLRYHQGLPVAKMATLLGKSEAVVSKRLSRALERLRKIIKVSNADK